MCRAKAKDDSISVYLKDFYCVSLIFIRVIKYVKGKVLIGLSENSINV